MVIMARAYLQPVGDSGVSAELTFFESEDGGTLFVQGAASGMRMFGRYVTLVTDLESHADVTPPFTPPGPCMPSDHPMPFAVDMGDLTVDSPAAGRTFLGVWRGRFGAAIGTMRVLQIEKTTAAPFGVHIYEINTVSIRRPLAWSMSYRLRRTRPQRLSLQACGELVRIP